MCGCMDRVGKFVLLVFYNDNMVWLYDLLMYVYVFDLVVIGILYILLMDGVVEDFCGCGCGCSLMRRVSGGEFGGVFGVGGEGYLFVRVVWGWLGFGGVWWSCLGGVFEWKVV